MGKKRALPYWLPAGWKVEVKKGKKEKWYSDPSKGLKFCSKADVLRYLSSVGSNCSGSSNTKEMQDTGKFSTEKTSSEVLPPGWIKKMRVRRKGHKIRKDPYYIDPVSGQTFRSMKEVSRILETRQSGRFESNQCSSTSELGESISSLPDGADKQITIDRDASGKEVSSNHKLKLGAEHVTHSSCLEGSVSSSIEGSVPENAQEKDLGKVVSDPASGKKEDDGKVDSDPVSGENQEKEDDGKVVSDPGSGEHQEKDDDGKVFSDPVNGENQGKPPRDGVEKRERKTVHLKRKKAANLPRRMSKRLAGIEADTSLKLQTNNQGHLATVRQEETQAATNTDPVNSINNRKHVATAVSGIIISEKVETASRTTGKKHVTSPLKEREQPSPVERAKTFLSSCDGDKKGETALESSLSDLWTDPCIEFAIKTLTGTIPVINEQKVDDIPGPCPSIPPVYNPSSVSLPSDEIWADPCFMFAVKTLTGEIPIGEDLCSQKIVQRQCTTSQFQGNNGLVLPNIRFQEFGQANLPQFGAPGKALHMQQPAVAPNAYQNIWFTKFGSQQSKPLC